MREDMPDIVRECGRTRRPSHKTRKWSPPYRYALEDDGSPARVPMKPRRGDRKCSNMRYNPLTRALKSYVGKPWSEAYSALTSVFRRPTVTTLRAIGHAQWLFRKEELFVDDEGILHERRFVREKHRNPCYCRHCWTKHPVTDEHIHVTDLREKIRVIDKNHYAAKEEGIWYVYTIGWHKPTDIAHHEDTYNGWGQVNGSKPVTYAQCPDLPLWYEVDRRQASRKMLRHLGVRNDHPLTIHT